MCIFWGCLHVTERHFTMLKMEKMERTINITWRDITANRHNSLEWNSYWCFSQRSSLTTLHLHFDLCSDRECFPQRLLPLQMKTMLLNCLYWHRCFVANSRCSITPCIAIWRRRYLFTFHLYIFAVLILPLYIIIIYKPKGTGRYNNRTYCDHSNVEVVEVVEKHGV